MLRDRARGKLYGSRVAMYGSESLDALTRGVGAPSHSISGRLSSDYSDHDPTHNQEGGGRSGRRVIRQDGTVAGQGRSFMSEPRISFAREYMMKWPSPS